MWVYIKVVIDIGYKSKSKMNQVVDIIQDMIKSNQDILKILNCDDSDTNIYELPNLSRTEASKVVKEKILTRPREFADNQQCCYMVLQYGNKRYHHEKNMYFNGNTFDIVILCHNDIRINNIIGDRVLEIEQIIEDTFDGKNLDKVACKCYVRYSESVSAKSTDYTGRRLEIEFNDFKG